MLPAWIAGRVGCEHAVAVVGCGCGGHDAVGGEHDGTVEGGKFLLLLPPGVAVVAHQVFVFFQARIVVCGQHLAVGVDVDTGALGLLEQVFDVLEVVTRDEDAGVLAHAYVYPCDFGVAIGLGVGLVEQGHHVDAVFSRLEHGVEQLLHGGVGIGDGCKSLVHEGDDLVAHLAQAGCVLIVGCHALEAQHSELLERAQVLVAVAQHALATALGLVVGLLAAPFHLVVVGQVHAQLLGAGQQLLFQGDAGVHLAQDGLVVEVCIGNGREQGIYHEACCLLVDGLACLDERMLDCCHTAHHTEQQVLPPCSCRRFPTHTLDGATRSLGRLLALETKHIVCCSHVTCF